MSWNKTIPTSASKVKDADDAYRANFYALDDTMGREHNPMTSITSAGQELPGRCSVVGVGASATIAGLSSPPEGAIAFDTQNWDFYIYKTVWNRCRQIAQNTKMFFYNTTAPAGWELVALNDKALLVVNGTTLTGGVTGGSWTITGMTGTLNEHTHTCSDVISHTHTITSYGYWAYGPLWRLCFDNDTQHGTATTDSTGAATASTTGTTEVTTTSDSTWRPKAYGVICCNKL